MKNKNYRVSRATLYNNIGIFLDACLIKKHQFGKNISLYEKAYACNQHDHLICTECNKVIEFCDPRILEVQKTISKTFNFTINEHSLYFYGICKECLDKHKNS